MAKREKTYRVVLRFPTDRESVTREDVMSLLVQADARSVLIDECYVIPVLKPAKTRGERWAQAVASARAALEEMEDAQGTLEESIEEIREVQSEYEDWKDNLPDNLSSSSLAEKLEAITSIDLELDVESCISDIRDMLDEAEGADLPRGFGRD